MIDQISHILHIEPETFIVFIILSIVAIITSIFTFFSIKLLKFVVSLYFFDKKIKDAN